MSIRLVNGCVNCQNLTNNHFCTVHDAKVEEAYTCDEFDMRVSLKDEVECGTCYKFHTPECPRQEHAAVGMLCNEYAPKAVS
ncbi:hypothetical protein GO491_08785 [Flavobacteriaceae bacterium Ap0902]|nr:hypothetical protein [Flavobacteriaceae bacterium Ap0902]